MTHDPVIEVVNAISGTGRKVRRHGKSFKAQCPGHEDKTPSLEIDLGDKGAVLCCQAGCTTETIMQALGLPVEFLFSDYGQHEAPQPTEAANLRQPVPGCLATYFYEDENGKVLFRVERRKNKQFVQAAPDYVNPGEWKYTLGDTRRVPYRMPSVVAAAKGGETIFIVEGEKDVHTLEGEGLVATCNAGGAGKFKREYADYFAGANVVVLPDNDAPGLEHGEAVGNYLRELARTVKIVQLPDLPEKGDVSDWFAVEGNDVHKLNEIVVETVIRYSNRPAIFNAHDLMLEKFPDIKMAVPGIIAEGVTLLVGAPKIGKSWLSLGLGVDVAGGAGMALGTIAVEQGPVLYLALEDTERRLQRRLRLMLGETAAPPDLHFATRWPRLGSGGLDQLEDWITNHRDARMVIIDTWAKVKSAVDSNGGSMYDSDYGAITAVKNIADDYGVAIVFIHHQRKAADNDPLNTVAGSTGLTGAADATVVLTRSRSSEEGLLFVTGRDVEESRSIVQFEAETGRWMWLGEAEDMQEMNTEVQVVKLLQDNAPNTMGPTEVSEALNINLGTVKWLMSKMATENKIMRVKRGQYAPSGSMNPQVGPSSAQGATAVNGGIIVNTVTPAMPGLPRHLQGLPTPSGQMLVTDEEIEAALADDDGFGGVDDDDAEDAAEDE